MTEKDLIKKVITIIILLILLVGGYILVKPYIPIIESKYQQLSKSVVEIFSGEETSQEPTTVSQVANETRSESSNEVTTGSLQESASLISPASQNSAEQTDRSQANNDETPSTEVESATTMATQTTSNPLTTANEISTVVPQQKALDLEKYLTINFTGYDGSGAIDYRINMEQLRKMWTLSAEEFQSFIQSLSLDYDGAGHLKNQDQVSVTLTSNDTYRAYIAHPTFTVTVNGLKKQPVFTRKAIENALRLTYQGFSGSGTLGFDYQFNAPFGNLKLVIQNPKDDYRNGDKITIALTEASKASLEEQGYLVENSGIIQVALTQFKEPETISTEMINKHVVVSFLGTSGVGTARIDTTFQPPYSNYLNDKSFIVENNGAIKNNDNVKITVDEAIVAKMKENGLILENNGLIERTADNMREVSPDLKQIANWQDLIARLDEKMKQKFPDTLFGAYEVKTERYYYRPYHTPNDLIQIKDASLDGTIIGVYTIETYDRDKKVLRSTTREIFGYTDLFIDPNKKVNLDTLTEYSYSFDSTYTLDAVYQIMEGYNFKAVKLKD